MEGEFKKKLAPHVIRGSRLTIPAPFVRRYHLRDYEDAVIYYKGEPFYMELVSVRDPRNSHVIMRGEWRLFKQIHNLPMGKTLTFRIQEDGMGYGACPTFHVV